MEFVLNEYRRNLSDEVLITDVQETAKKLGKDSITGDEYTAHGKYCAETLRRRFGSWAVVLEKAGLDTKGHFSHIHFTDELVIEDVRRVAAIYQKETLTLKEYNKYGEYSGHTLVKKYKTWVNVLKMAGLKQTKYRFFPNEELFEDIERMWIQLGRQPTVGDINKGYSKFSVGAFIGRFGSWRKALEAFVEYINSEEEDSEKEVVEEAVESADHGERISPEHQTSRTVNLRLRFLVLHRDHFKCCACGASPAKDPSVELHVDHIVPWSKGGETVIDNLQTLCSNCNLGKSDLL